MVSAHSSRIPHLPLIDLLHNNHAGQGAFSRLEFLWQIPPPIFQSAMNFAESLHLRLFPSGLLLNLRVVEVFDQVATDFTKLR